MTGPVDAVVHLCAAGVSVLVDLTGGRLPAIISWGPDLGELARDEALDLVVSGDLPTAGNVVEEPVRLALLPEHRTGWTGRPGLSGSRNGRDWSPKFAVRVATLDGRALETGEGDGTPALVTGDAGVLVVEAADERSGLELAVTLELSPVGLLRARAELTNSGATSYALNDLVLALPVPPIAREILDFAGHWGKERAPQRRTLTTGTHLREGRHGPDRAGRDHAAAPGQARLRLRERRGLGGARRLERQPHPLRRAGVHR